MHRLDRSRTVAGVRLASVASINSVLPHRLRNLAPEAVAFGMIGVVNALLYFAIFNLTMAMGAVKATVVATAITTTLAYATEALSAGCELVLNAAVTSVRPSGGGHELDTARGPVRAAHLVNAAGLRSDEVDGMLGHSGFRVTPRRGELIVFDKLARGLVNHVLLPVPTEKTKGVLVSPTIYGNVLLGPTAEDQQDRTRAPCEEAVLRRILAEGVAILPALADETVSATFAGLRPATEHRDIVLAVDDRQSWITVAGIRSTGLSAALGLGEWAAENGSRLLGEARAAPPDDDLDWPKMPNLSASSPRPFEQPGRSAVVCHCEWVTEREIQAALDASIAPGTLGGLKRRTRVMMGRCQGFGCTAAVRSLAPQLFRGAAG